MVRDPKVNYRHKSSSLETLHSSTYPCHEISPPKACTSPVKHIGYCMHHLCTRCMTSLVWYVELNVAISLNRINLDVCVIKNLCFVWRTLYDVVYLQPWSVLGFRLIYDISSGCNHALPTPRQFELHLDNLSYRWRWGCGKLRMGGGCECRAVQSEWT